MNFCILGIGNVGDEYKKTRHNTGFILLDQFAKNHELEFVLKKHAYVATFPFRSHNFYFLKPTTFVNLSGTALRYWMDKLKVEMKNVLVVVDDIYLELGNMRFRNSGGSGGHNGLKNIELNLGSENYKRLRIGIGHGFTSGHQSNYVINDFSDEELKKILSLSSPFEDIVKSFTEQNDNIRTKIINDILSKLRTEEK